MAGPAPRYIDGLSLVGDGADEHAFLETPQHNGNVAAWRHLEVERARAAERAEAAREGEAGEEEAVREQGA